MIVYGSVRSKKVELKKKVERYAKDGEQGEVMPTVQNEIVRDGFARGMKYERCVCVFGRPIA